MLRANRMKTQGSASRRNDRSAALRFGPLTPVISARSSINTELARVCAKQFKRRRSVLLDYALHRGRSP